MQSPLAAYNATFIANGGPQRRNRDHYIRATEQHLGLPHSARRSVKALAWLTLVDEIGPARFWPRYVRRLLWKNHLNFKERFKCCVFLFKNGCLPNYILDWFQVRPRALRDRSARNHVRALLKAMDEDKPCTRKWFAWDITTGHTMHLDGIFHKRSCNCGR